MDLVTHALSGLAIGAVGAAYGGNPREQWPLMLAGAAAAVAPDLDALVGLRSKLAAWRYHRILLHGLPTLPLQVLALYLLAQALLAEPPPPGVLALTIAGGLLAHLILDTATSFGTVLGYPFSRRRFSTHSHFIIDPVVLGALALGLALDRPAYGLGVAAAWLALGVAVRYRLSRTMRRAVQALGWDATGMLIEPGPLAPLRWLVVVRRGPEASALATVSWRGQVLSPWQDIRWQCHRGVREQALRIPLVQAFLETAHSPHWEWIETRPQGSVLVLEDLKWRVVPPFRPLAFVVRMADSAAPSPDLVTAPPADQALQMPLWWRGPGPGSALSRMDTDAEDRGCTSDDATDIPPLPAEGKPRRAVIVTTAAPPWYTGTALNALHRAKALDRQGWEVQLVFPWLAPDAQAQVYPSGLRFASPGEQAQWIRQAFESSSVQVCFYPARWSARWRSIFPAGPLAPHLTACDLLVLEEPEHLALFQPWMKIKQQAQAGTVVGILHTNYALYLGEVAPWFRLHWVQSAFKAYLGAMASRNCDRVIRLSAAVDGPRDAEVAAVNGVGEPYLGAVTDDAMEGCYFIGKLTWEKGWEEMLALLASAPEQGLHVFGAGNAARVADIAALAHRHKVRLVMHGPSHAPWHDLRPYKIFINCSRSEVLCTATAEALAMGKFALVPRHPSNAFFEQHPNCLVYDNPEGFQKLLAHAMATPPEREDSRPLFSWDAATSRLFATLGRQLESDAGEAAGRKGQPVRY